jgi:hypothetical protein
MDDPHVTPLDCGNGIEVMPLVRTSPVADRGMLRSGANPVIRMTLAESMA